MKITDWLNKQFDICLICLARKILIGRNVQRAPFVSRRDNNKMWVMAESLKTIENRMKSNYK